MGTSFLPLPAKVARKNKCKMFIINPQNRFDNICFQWAILPRYIEGVHKERVDAKYSKI